MSDFSAGAVGGRFSSLLSKQDCPKPLYDQVLARVHNCVVTPTLGSIIPNWLLVIPEEPVLNFSAWHNHCGISPKTVVDDLLHQKRIHSDRAIWFEHGAAHPGSVVGCGVDHAHLHLLVDAPFSLHQMISAASDASKLHFEEAMSAGIYNGAHSDSAYLLLASGEEAFFARNVEHVGSQFLRRVVAGLVGCVNSWNYRTHPHLDNVSKTIQAFRAA